MKAFVVVIPVTKVLDMLKEVGELDRFVSLVSNFPDLVAAVLQEIPDGRRMSKKLKKEIVEAVYEKLLAHLKTSLFSEPAAREFSPADAFAAGQERAREDVLDLAADPLRELPVSEQKGTEIYRRFAKRINALPIAVLVEDVAITIEAAFLAGQRIVREKSMEILSTVLEELKVEGAEGIHTAYYQALAELPLTPYELPAEEAPAFSETQIEALRASLKRVLEMTAGVSKGRIEQVLEAFTENLRKAPAV